MEKLNRNIHLKLQEMCECYMESDFLPELSKTAAFKGEDLEENSIKYLALAILEALTQKAGELTVAQGEEVQVTASAFDGKTIMPPPSKEMTAKIFEIIRSITHIEDANGESALAFGFRNDQLDLLVTLKKEEGKESLKIVFPELEPC